ncbi:NlpC/P60 family protein [Cognatishimia sp. MH4019]|uniref:NlpC/P60 family protein n=1 Tax=Cognatishimia sp. MH4019 TaxID=2854030 RepID=UPI001CD4582C|nr:NlpC/P60 family protein [Cognatishimia sp. MH4019]
MSRVVTAARGWIGTPYRHQASTRGAGADCLGLIRGVWREVCGAEPVDVPAYTADWAEPQGEEALMAASSAHLQRYEEPCWDVGTVILFRMKEAGLAKHLGILSESGAAPKFIHAYSGHAVVESALSAPWRRRVVGWFAFPERSL